MTKRAENKQPEDESHPFFATPPEGFVSSNKPVDPNDIPTFSEVPELAADLKEKIDKAKTPAEHPLTTGYKRLKDVLESNKFKVVEQRGESEEPDENGVFIHKTYTTLERKKGFRKPKGKITIISTSKSDKSFNYEPVSNEIKLESTDQSKYWDFYMDIYWTLYEAGLKMGRHDNTFIGRNIRKIESEIDPATKILVEIVKTLKSAGFNAQEQSPGNWNLLRNRKFGKVYDLAGLYYDKNSKTIQIYINTQNHEEEQKIRKDIKQLLEKNGHTLSDHTTDDRFDYHFGIDLDKAA